MVAQFYLASGSPRRWEILQQLGYEMAPLVAPIDEVPYLGEAALDYVARMAYEKNAAARVVLAQAQGADLPILTADTTVALAGQILGKPLDAEEARAMLGRLSGSTHQVLSAVCVSYRGRCVAKVQVSDVAFKVLSEEEISAYVATGEPMDKAGGYGVQGQAGLFVRHLAGSFTGVMGLPAFETAQLLAGMGCLPRWQEMRQKAT